MKPKDYLVLLGVSAALTVGIVAMLRHSGSPQDDRAASVAELRDKVRAGAPIDDSTKKALQQDEIREKAYAAQSQKNYGPLGTTADEILSHENDQYKTNVFPALLWRLNQKIEKKGWENLTDTERQIIAVQALRGAVYDGGFSEYFFESWGGDAAVAKAGLDAIGATNSAVILQRALAVFPGGNAPTDRQRRWDVMDKIEAQSGPVWNKCDKEFYDSKEDLDALSLAYARKNKAEIILP
jgi:hypothetical protein